MNLANERALARPTFYSHMTRPPDRWDYGTDYIFRAQRYAVQDRFHLGGLVYGDVARGGTKIQPNVLRMIEAHLVLHGSFTVLMVATEDWLRQRLAAQEELDHRSRRKEMYNADVIIDANQKFIDLSLGDRYEGAHVDVVHNVARDGFPTEEHMHQWITSWVDRVYLADTWAGTTSLWL